MSPVRIVSYEACPHAVCEEYISTGRGFVRRTIICQHAKNEGCVCIRSIDPNAECTWLKRDLEESLTEA